jgi:hypothetical protein
MRSAKWDDSNRRADMPAQWIFRRNVKGDVEGIPLRCLHQDAIIAEPGFLRIEECLAQLLRSGESCTGTSDWRPILRHGIYVGHLEFSAEYPT